MMGVASLHCTDEARSCVLRFMLLRFCGLVFGLLLNENLQEPSAHATYCPKGFRGRTRTCDWLA